MTDQVTVSRELLRQALEALEEYVYQEGATNYAKTTITALRTALEQPVAEPACKQPLQVHKPTGWVAHKNHYAMPVLFNPYTGEPRDVRDVQSDPQGVLIVPPGKVEMIAASPPPPDEPAVEPIDGDILPPIGSRVFIRHGSDGDAHACTVTGYYAWGDLGGNKHLSRVFVRLVYEGTDCQQARMLCDCWPTVEAALNNTAPQPQQPQLLSDDDILHCWSPGMRRPVLGMNKVVSFARAVEQDVLRKNGVLKYTESFTN